MISSEVENGYDEAEKESAFFVEESRWSASDVDGCRDSIPER
jgi:hypothetical protein